MVVDRRRVTWPASRDSHHEDQNVAAHTLYTLPGSLRSQA